MGGGGGDVRRCEEGEQIRREGRAELVLSKDFHILIKSKDNTHKNED